MLPQTASRKLLTHAVHLYALVARLLTGDERDITTGNTEDVRQEGDQRLVGCALDRRSVETDEDRVTPHAVDTSSRRARNDADIQNCGRQTANRKTADLELARGLALFEQRLWRRGRLVRLARTMEQELVVSGRALLLLVADEFERAIQRLDRPLE